MRLNHIVALAVVACLSFASSAFAQAEGCCHPDGTCTVEDVAACGTAGGHHTSQADCSGTVCGACCLTGGSCPLGGSCCLHLDGNPTGGSCDDFGGTYGGAGSSCGPLLPAEDNVYECPQVTGVCEDPAPRTQGFWQGVCKKDHPDQPDRSILTPELCDDLNPDPPSDPCERARSHYAALLYNIASDRVREDCVDDITGDTVEDSVVAIEALIAEGTRNSCKTASDLAASLNEGNVSEPS